MIEQFYIDNRRVLLKKICGRGVRLQDAEDVLHEAFTRALNYYHTWDEDRSPLGAWFNTIMNNAVKDYKKAEKLQGMVRDTSEGEAVGPDDIQLNELLAGKLKGELEGRSPLHRNVLELYFMQGLKPKSILQIVDANWKTVGSVIYRFRREMREKYNVEPE